MKSPTKAGVRAGLISGLLVLGLAGCGAGDRNSGMVDRDTLTQRQKDSITATLPVPGAGAVGKALDAADAARARAEQHDTIG